MILMNLSTCQFENVQGKQMKEAGIVYMLSFTDSKLQTFLPSYAFEVMDWNGIIDNLPTWNIIKLEVLFLLGFLIFHCSLVCLGLWSLIPLTKFWSCCCFTFSPKCIWCDGNYFSPFFPSLTNFVGCKKKKVLV